MIMYRGGQACTMRDNSKLLPGVYSVLELGPRGTICGAMLSVKVLKIS
jgi:hypothetical protein